MHFSIFMFVAERILTDPSFEGLGESPRKKKTKRRKSTMAEFIRKLLTGRHKVHATQKPRHPSNKDTFFNALADGWQYNLMDRWTVGNC